MKILHLAYTMDTRNGIGRLAHEVITGLKAAGHEAVILVEKASGYPGEKVVLKRSYGMLSSLKDVYAASQGVDLIYAWELNPYGYMAYLTSRLTRIPYYVNANGTYSVAPLFNPKTRLLSRATYFAAIKIPCISSYVENEIRKVLPQAPTTVITLGVDFEKFSGQRFEPARPFIVGVGNVGRRKGYHISIPAFAKVAREFPNLDYRIAGTVESNFYNRSQELIKEYGLEGRVIFEGSLGDVELKKLYLSAEIFILTSINYSNHFEGFGLVFLEAAAAGLPVVGTSDNGIRDAMRDGENGILVPQNDIEATGDALLQLMRDPARRKKYGERSIEIACTNVWDQVVAAYDKLFSHGIK